MDIVDRASIFPKSNLPKAFRAGSIFFWKEFLMRKAFWFGLIAAVLAFLGAGSGNGTSVAQAADLTKLETSLPLIPADAAFYSSSLRNREQLEMFLKSNAFAKLKELPITQLGVQMFRAQAANPKSEVAQALAVLKNPETKRLVDLAADMFSNEVFLYGDKNCSDFLELMLEINAATTYGPMIYQLQGEGEHLRPEQLQGRAVMAAIAENIDIVNVPNILMGFKLDKPAAANEALVKLEMFVNVGLAAAPPQLQECVKRETIAGHEYLVLRLDGGMIPWQGNETEKLEMMLGIDAEEAEKIIEHVKNMKLVVAFGVRENYLLATIGSSTACIEKLGEGDKLADLPQLKPLAAFADRKLLSVGYVSAEMAKAANNQDKILNQLYTLLETFVNQTDMDAEKTEKIMGDAQMFVEDIKGIIPEPGAETAFSFLADKGMETYDYKWGEHAKIDGSKPLGLLEHVGGNPLFGIVSRSKTSVKDFEQAKKWLGIGWKYFNEYAVPTMREEERTKFKAYAKDMMPLLERLDRATCDLMIPALADGQAAVVIDGKFTTKQLQNELPEWEKPMPFPELAIVVGVSDANLLKQGVKEYMAVAREVIEVVKKHDPEAIEEFKKDMAREGIEMPQWQVTEGSGYTIYGLPIPEKAGLDKNLLPNAGLSEHVAVLSLSSRHSERLLKKTPFTAGGVLEKTDKPLAIAVWFNWADLLDKATPWIDYAFEQIEESKLGGDRKSAIDQAHAIIEVLKCYRTITAESRIEADCLVTHSLLEIQDVKK
jgi:hypothetical protein